MIGHECKLSRTNANGIVWVCECGEIGDVIPMVGIPTDATLRSRRRVELTEGIARARHGGHLDDVRADVARQSNRYLESVGQAINASNAILQRRGRWGHP